MTRSNDLSDRPWSRRAFTAGVVGGGAIALTLPLLARAQQAQAPLAYPFPAAPAISA